MRRTRRHSLPFRVILIAVLVVLSGSAQAWSKHYDHSLSLFYPGETIPRGVLDKESARLLDLQLSEIARHGGIQPYIHLLERRGNFDHSK